MVFRSARPDVADTSVMEAPLSMACDACARRSERIDVTPRLVTYARIVGWETPFKAKWMQRDMRMSEHEKIAKVLRTRLSELRTHHAKVDRELHKPLPADSEEQAAELENQEALEVIERTEIAEIRQIEAALQRISQGTYGTCTKCGGAIDPRRLKALPTAATCISCST